MVFSSGWNLVSHPSANDDLVISKLIQRAKSYVEEIGKERYEFEFDGITARHSRVVETYDKHMLENGMYKAAEESHMYLDLRPDLKFDTDLPPGIEVVGLFSMEREKLVQQFFEIFGDSRDELWTDMTKDQQTIACNYWFAKDRPLAEDATFIALKDGKVVGVHIARPDGEVVDIGPVGIHPNFRRQGLASALFGKSLNILVGQGCKRVTLDVSVSNTPAFTMYDKLGFKEMHKKAFYAWRVEK
jgi:ribosomal protein S18 acetylase RimI-like enzyme